MCFCSFRCDPQVIPELTLQVSELQRQKHELEVHVEEQSTELAGKSEYLWSDNIEMLFQYFTYFLLFIFYSMPSGRKNRGDHQHSSKED